MAAKQTQQGPPQAEYALSQMVASALRKMSDTLSTLTALIVSMREAQEESSLKILSAIQTIAHEMHQAHSSIEQDQLPTTHKTSSLARKVLKTDNQDSSEPNQLARETQIRTQMPAT